MQQQRLTVDHLEGRVGRKGSVRVKGNLPFKPGVGVVKGGGGGTQGRGGGVDGMKEGLKIDMQGLELRMRNAYNGMRLGW